MSAPKTDSHFEALLEYLKQARGFDFTGYKRPSLMRRVDKRMQAAGVDGYQDYHDYLEVHPEEFAQLFDTILINVTAFYRDRPAWDYLAAEVIPQIIAGKAAGEPIRCWSAGCASGEEPYTLATVLAEALGEREFRRRVKIYATDVDEDAMLKARQGAYTDKELKPVPEALRERYFEQVGSHFIFRSNLRRSVIFGRLDLVQDAPISRLDLLLCRNTLMYFNVETQARILARFHFSLNDIGALFLGKAEMLLTHTDLFTPRNLGFRVFSKVPKLNVRDRMQLFSQARHDDADNHIARAVRLREAAFDTAPIAQLVVDVDGALALANSEARSMFNLNANDIGRPFRDLEVSYRPLELRSRIEQALSEGQPVDAIQVERSRGEGEHQHLNVRASPLMDIDGKPLAVVVGFTDVTETVRLQMEYQRSSQELETAQEELQSTNEELETTNEELQSSNEELETTNEELQSANEELETTNEELQSANEELQAINDELLDRTDALNQVNSFFESVLYSLRAAAVAVDPELTILSWNEGAVELWGLRADEVKGQSLAGLDIGLPVGRLRAPIENVLAGTPECEINDVEAVNRRGKTVRCRVTCTPLLDAERKIAGALVLMEPQG